MMRQWRLPLRPAVRFAVPLAACSLSFFLSLSLSLLCAPALAFAEPAATAAPAALAAAGPVPRATGPKDIVDWCRRLVQPLPGIRTADCVAAELTPSGGKSYKGFPLLARHVVPAGLHKDKAIRVLLMGGIHGDELTAPAIVFEWIKFLAQDKPADIHWRVVPVMNPDGLLMPQPRRTNANGVDLNRNFPTPGWEKDARAYWMQKTRSDPRRFPGKSPLSEPESRWLHDEMERFRPHVIVSVHAPFGVLDFDGPAEPPKRFGRLIFNRVGVYPGSLGNYGGFHKNVPVITIELPNARAMPPEGEVKRIWTDMLAWIEKNVSAEDPPETRGAPSKALRAVTAFK